MVSYPDYYRLLGIYPNHEPDEIREAFLSRWKKFEVPLHGEKIFIKHLGRMSRKRDLILESYMVLSSPLMKDHYDGKMGIKTEKLVSTKDGKIPSIFFREGCRLLVHRNYEEAFEIFRKGLDRCPNNANLLNYTAFSLLAAGTRIELAKKYVARSRTIDPVRAETYLLQIFLLSKYERAPSAVVKKEPDLTKYKIFDLPLYIRLRQMTYYLLDNKRFSWKKIWGNLGKLFITKFRISC